MEGREALITHVRDDPVADRTGGITIISVGCHRCLNSSDKSSYCVIITIIIIIIIIIIIKLTLLLLLQLLLLLLYLYYTYYSHILFCIFLNSKFNACDLGLPEICYWSLLGLGSAWNCRIRLVAELPCLYLKGQ